MKHTPMSYEELINRGNEALNRGNEELAKALFSKAKDVKIFEKKDN